jgi:hypothetical protein
MLQGEEDPLSPQLLDLDEEVAEDTNERDLDRLKQVCLAWQHVATGDGLAARWQLASVACIVHCPCLPQKMFSERVVTALRLGSMSGRHQKFWSTRVSSSMSLQQ